jgi:sigma-B regulation protein RsbU (phosphoserine phosphatase)
MAADTGATAPVSAELSIRADVGELRRASGWLEANGHQHGVPEEHIGRLDLCLNEALANVIAHGSAALEAPVLLHMTVGRCQGQYQASVTVIDSGPRFDTTTAELKAVPSCLADAEPGGLGLRMIRSLSDAQTYQYVDGLNELTFSVRWVGDEAAPAPVRSYVFKRDPDRRVLWLPRRPERRLMDRRLLELDWIPLFREVSPEAVINALADSQVLTLPAGAELLTLGETNHTIYIPLSGTIAAYLDASSDPENAIPIPSGECVGELSAIDGKPVSARVVALTDARVLKISREVFWDRLMTLPSVARNLRITLSERMRRTSEMALKAQRQQLELIQLRKELDVARQLQASMLPLQRPLFAERTDIEVCGFMEPASNVGGDLFDAFFVRDHQLFICIGDVSGHGIASALFMARTIGLLRMLAMNTVQPDELLRQLNGRLCIGNDTNIFITLFCGFYDIRSGTLLYSNGGHCAPILRSADGSRHIAIPKGPLLGAFEGIKFGAAEISLKPGDTLFCYTDGVTEAQTATGKEFTEERCLTMLDEAGSLPLSELLDPFRKEVARFTDSDLLEDDCTMLAMRRPER